MATLGCASSPQRLAAERAVDDLIEQLQTRRLALDPVAEGRATPRRTAVQADYEGGLRDDVLLALAKRQTGLEILTTGREEQDMLELAAKQVGDEFWQGDGLEALGKKLKAELFITTSAQRVADGQVEIVLKLNDLSTHGQLAVGLGSSFEKWEQARKWTFFGVRCLAVPFVAVYDIGRTSAAYAFPDGGKPSFGGAVGGGLLVLVYSPVALFRSDYEETRRLFGADPKAEAAGDATDRP